MAKPSVAYSRIKKINIDGVSYHDDLLAAEEPLEIRLGFGGHGERKQKSISVTMRTPGNDFELALGFLFIEGIIKSYDNVTEIKYCTQLGQIEDKENIVRVELTPDFLPQLKNTERNFYTTSSCGICGKASIEAIKTAQEFTPCDFDFTVEADTIFELQNKLSEKQDVFKHTGGLHASALFDSAGDLILLREDVGRHNALDKLIGAALAKNLVPLSDSVLLLSGRASFELLQKAAMAGINIVAAVGAPSSLAVDTAKEFNITLIGFLRDKRFNIYSSEQRIKIKNETADQRKLSEASTYKI